MREGGMSNDEYKKFMSEGSGNVAADGMFSIQVRHAHARACLPAARTAPPPTATCPPPPPPATLCRAMTPRC